MDEGSQRILIVGVGGQGVVFASKIIGEAIMKTGQNVIMGEVHGMAQRGGVVTCTVCIGDVHGSIIGDGEADIILSFEPIEAYRTIQKASRDSIIITNKAMFIPVTVNIGDVKYPELEDVFGAIKEVSENLVIINATKLAVEMGSHVMANSVMLGALAGTKKLTIEPSILKQHLLTRVPQKMVDLNSKAFDVGFEFTASR